MKSSHLFFAAIKVPLDYFILLAAASLAYWIRFSPQVVDIRPVTFSLPFSQYLQIASFICGAWIIIFALSKLYFVQRQSFISEIGHILFGTSTGIAFILALSFLSRELFESRFIVLAFWGLSILFITIERALIRGLIRSLRKYGVGMKSIVLIGASDAGKRIVEIFTNQPKFGYVISAKLKSFSSASEKKILSLRDAGKADILLIADTDLNKEQVAKIKSFSDIEHLEFMYAADLFPAGKAKPMVHNFVEQIIIQVPKTPLDNWGAIYKRIFDIIFSILLIIITLPIQIIVALAIFIESPGRILFFHDRVGQGGQSFRYFKFRSMIKNAHKYRFDDDFIKKHGNMRADGPLFKLKDDPRVTRVGKIIRKLSIDEFPEFYQVLIGNMSLVGPRPHMPEEVKNYKPHQKAILNIKPGITGLAQVSGRADISFDEETKLDLYYMENWRPWLDLWILIKTPIVILFKSGTT